MTRDVADLALRAAGELIAGLPGCSCVTWVLVVRLEPSGERIGAVCWPTTRPAPVLPTGWLPVGGTFSRATAPEDLAARITDSIRRAELPTADLVVEAQINRARACEPIRAVRILASAARSLVRRRGATAERWARLRAEIEETKARVWAGRN